MQKYILSKKNLITLTGGILIALAYFAEFGFESAALAQGALVAASVLGLAPIAIQAYQALRVKVVSIDVLVTIAVLGAFLIREFEESAIVTFLFLFGAYLELRTLNKTRSAIRELTEMAPESALKRGEGGEFEEVGIEEVGIGDVLLVKTGAKIPVDGTVTLGEGYVNEASITGESMPAGKTTGARVYAGTILENGTIQILADRVGEDTTFGKIIELVEEAQDSKSEAERFIDRFSKHYTPVVLLIAVAVWLVSRDIDLAITILVLGCPGALVIGVPVSNVAGIGNGAQHGILLKGSDVIQNFSKVDAFVFDKTGTLTAGNPRVADAEVYTDDPGTVYSYLAGVEGESDHPLAKAILAYIGDTKSDPVEDTDVVKGGGIVARVGGRRVAVGNVALMQRENVFLSEKAREDIAGFELKGKHPRAGFCRRRIESFAGHPGSDPARCQKASSKAEVLARQKPDRSVRRQPGDCRPGRPGNRSDGSPRPHASGRQSRLYQEAPGARPDRGLCGRRSERQPFAGPGGYRDRHGERHRRGHRDFGRSADAFGSQPSASCPGPDQGNRPQHAPEHRDRRRRGGLPSGERIPQ